MEHELKMGQALVITGPQGCGKTTLARQIAKAHGGTFIDVDASALETKSGLRDVLLKQPSTIIVDEFPSSPDTTDTLKSLIAGEAIAIRPRYGAERSLRVRAPNFIFCTGSVDFLPEGQTSKRFSVIDLGKASPTAEAHSEAEKSAEVETIETLTRERGELHQIVRDCLAALSNGSGATEECSIQFLREAPKEIKAEVERLRGEIEARQWQPIETAPKDGTTVIVGRNMGDFFGFVRGTGWFEGDPKSFMSGWVSRGFTDPPGELGLAHPTHWMPLPTTPIDAARAEAGSGERDVSQP